MWLLRRPTGARASSENAGFPFVLLKPPLSLCDFKYAFLAG